MSPIPVHLQLLSFFYGSMVLGTLLVMWLGHVSAVQAGWRVGGWAMVLQAIGWGGLLSLAGIGWLHYLLHTNEYLPIAITPSLTDWLVLVLLAPVVQETFFRGAILGGMRRSWHPFWATVLSAALFTVYLPMQQWLAFAFLTGVGYAMAFWLSGSVLAPMVANAAVSATLLYARLHPKDVGAMSWQTLGKVAAVFVLCSLLGLLFRRGDKVAK
jgi:membrane protease YdiL (CAAX protease family)